MLTIEAPAVPDVISETLHWVNEERVAMGRAPLDRLPCGTPGSFDGCPIAVALGPGVSVVDCWYKHDSEEEIHLLPEAALDFVTAYDDLQYPELIG